MKLIKKKHQKEFKQRQHGLW